MQTVFIIIFKEMCAQCENKKQTIKVLRRYMEFISLMKVTYLILFACVCRRLDMRPAVGWQVMF